MSQETAVETRQNTLFANAQLVPTNLKICYDIAVLRSRVEWAILRLEETLGQKLNPLFLEPGYLTIDQVRDLLDSEDEVLTTAKLWYKPGKRGSTFLLVGVVNHLLFDRRTAEMVLDPDVSLDRIQATPPALQKQLRQRYEGRLFFKRMVGDLGTFANTLDVVETQPSMMPQVVTAPQDARHHDLYSLFYELVGCGLEGRFLLFVVKDQYNTEFKRTGLVRAHSWYGYFVRAVSFPCSREAFMAQVKDDSVHHDELFKASYRAAWTLNDHSNFALSNPNFALRDNEMYVSEGLSLNLIRWLSVISRSGPMCAGSFFFVQGLKDGQYSVMIQRCYDPVNQRRLNMAIGAAVVLLLGAASWSWLRRRQ